MEGVDGEGNLGGAGDWWGMWTFHCGGEAKRDCRGCSGVLGEVCKWYFMMILFDFSAKGFIGWSND